jgi:hypothetical protein
MLRRIFRIKKCEIKTPWAKQNNNKLHNFYHAPNIFRAIKSRSLQDNIKWISCISWGMDWCGQNRQCLLADPCEHNNEHLCPLKEGNILTNLSLAPYKDRLSYN